MSKFFAQDSSSDEEESKESDDSSSEEEGSSEVESEAESEEQKPEPKADAKPKGMAAFLKGDDSSSDEDDGKRVVRSHRDKKWEQITDAVTELRGHLGEDWVKVSASFDSINKMLAKAATLVAKEGMPIFYFKLLVLLESETDKATEDKAALKKLSSSNAKAVNTLKQKLRKVAKPYEKEIEKLRIKKESTAQEGNEEDDDDVPTALRPEAGAQRQRGKGSAGPTGPKAIKDYNEQDIDERLDELLGKRGRKGTKKQDEINVLKQLAEVTKRPSKLVELLGHIISFNFDIHNNMLTAMPTPVWKDVFAIFRRLLTTLVDNPELKIEQIEGTTVVDAVQMTTAELGDEPDEYIDTGVTQMTGNVLAYLERLDDEFYKSLQLADPHTADYVARLKDEVPLINLMQDTLAYYDSKISALGMNATAFVNLDEAGIAKEVQSEWVALQRDGARVANRIIEHVYYREQSLFNTAASNAEKRKKALLEMREQAILAAKKAKMAADDASDDEDYASESDEDASKKESELRKTANQLIAAARAAGMAYEEFTVPRAMQLQADIEKFARRVYAHGSDRAKTRTLLCCVFHEALHERYQQARDLLLMSHLCDSIHQFDVSTQILYNRALVRCGICAFQQGLLPEAHAALMELASGARLKELLAQGVSSQRFGDRNVEQEKQERRRLVPYHMHINLELVEAVHLVCAMLLELPNLAHNAFDPRRRTSTVSRAFRRQLDHFERQVFNGPPEHTRDFVMTASQLVLEGKWLKAAQTLAQLPAWELLPDPGKARTFIREQLMSEGMRAFLISSYAHFESISLADLARRFDVTEAHAHAVVSRMLLNHELHASWDQPTGTLAVQRTEPSKLQFLALQFAEKASQFVEANELLFDLHAGSHGYKDSDGRHGRDFDGRSRDGGYRGERERRPWVERSERYRDRGYDRGGYDGTTGHRAGRGGGVGNSFRGNNRNGGGGGGSGKGSSGKTRRD